MINHYKNSWQIFLAIFFILLTFPAFTQVRLPQLIGDHMVLQRGKPLKIWGWATPGEKVAIIFNGIKMIAITDQEGKWNTSFRAMKAGGPYKMDIIGHNKISLEDIMIGDVWFCSGQSNMVLPMERLKYQYPREVSQDSFPRIRNFFVQTKAYVLKEKEDLPPGKWTPAIGKGLLEFGGVSYFFAKKLYQKYQVPIGLINASVGGSPIEAWLSVEGYRNFPQYQAEIANFRNLQHRKALDSAVSAYTTAHSKPLSVLIDKGISGPVKWIDTAYVPKKWHPFFLPGYWSDQGVKRLNGIIYFRKEIELPAFLSGMPARLLMGNITDADSTFINGVFVGNTTYQYPPRNYNVPSGVLKSGRNIIVVKVVSNSGKGGFVPDKKYQIEAAGQRFDLRGDWSYQVGMVYEKPNEMPLVNVNDTIPRPINEQSSATGLFNAMVSPVTGYPIRGFLWYQGETNTARANEYGQILKALIADWRDKWREGDIPFIYAQLPNFMEVEYSPSESSWAALRQAQLETLSVSNTGMAVTIDAGEWNDIHPLNKKDIGERMALWAEYFQGEDKKIVFSGPLISTARKKGDKVVLNFNHLGGGLKSRDGEDLRYFSIAGADGRYKWAKAIIQGNEILVWNEEVSSPVYLRYAWADNPQSANLINAEGLPASPFQVKIEQ